MLVALTNADRCLDMAALDLCFQSHHGDSAKFIIPGLAKIGKKGHQLRFLFTFPEYLRIQCEPSML